MLDLIQFTPPISVSQMRDLRFLQSSSSSLVFQPGLESGPSDSQAKAPTPNSHPKTVKTLLSCPCVINSGTCDLAVIILQKWIWWRDKETPPFSFWVNFCIKLVSRILPRLTHPTLPSILSPSPQDSPLSSLFASFAAFELMLHCWGICVQSPMCSSSCWNLA